MYLTEESIPKVATKFDWFFYVIDLLTVLHRDEMFPITYKGEIK